MKSVAIIGFSDRTFNYCLKSKADEFWSMNHSDLVMKIPHLERLFEIHKRGWYLRKEVNEIEKYDSWLRQPHPFPIYMQRAELTDLVPSGVGYPMEEICATLLGNLVRVDPEGIEKLADRYFTSSVSFMIACAIYEGFKRIELYGIDMAYDTEYGFQKPCGEFWLGQALGRGVQVVLPDICNLLNAPVYGYEIVPYIDSTLINELLSQYQIKEQDYIVEMNEAGALYNADPSDQVLIDNVLEKSAYAYLYQGAVTSAINLLNESDTYISRQFVEMKMQQFVKDMDLFRNIYNQKRTLHDHIMAEGKSDPKLWQDAQDARASMYANLGALQLFAQLLNVIDMRPFERRLTLTIEEKRYQDA